jgi:RND family efflux transporter MFP subunit
MIRCVPLLSLVSLVWLIGLTASAGPAKSAEQATVAADVTTCLAKPKQVIQLGSAVFGVLAEVFVDRAEPVKRGQIVAKLDTSVEEAQVALDRHRAANTTQIEAAEADLQWNLRELERRQKLAENKFAKLNDMDEIATKIEQDRIAIRRAETDRRTAIFESNRSESQLQLKLIRSPVDGVVTELKLMPGEFIYETTPIMTIAQIDPLNIDVVLPAERYRSVKTGLVAELRLYAPVDRTYEATVDAVDPVIDVASDTFRVRLVLPNQGNAIPAGVRCSVNLPAVTASGN